jgi:hypothetical protein
VVKLVGNKGKSASGVDGNTLRVGKCRRRAYAIVVAGRATQKSCDNTGTASAPNVCNFADGVVV